MTSPRLEIYARRAGIRLASDWTPPTEDVVSAPLKGRTFPLYLEIAFVGVIIAVCILAGFVVTSAGSNANWQW